MANILQQMQALLEMIEPSEEELKQNPNAGGVVNYTTSKEFYTIAMEYIRLLEEIKVSVFDSKNYYHKCTDLYKFKKKHNII